MKKKIAIMAVTVFISVQAMAFTPPQKPTVSDNINAFLVGVDTGMHGLLSGIGRTLYKFFA